MLLGALVSVCIRVIGCGLLLLPRLMGLKWLWLGLQTVMFLVRRLTYKWLLCVATNVMTWPFGRSFGLVGLRMQWWK